MATTSRATIDDDRDIDYPTGDGRPMAETDLHRRIMSETIERLEMYFDHDQNVYVSGNLLVFYEPGDRRKHVAPDVFVVRGVPKLPPRKNYLIWREGKAPELVIELTSDTTRRVDEKKKPALYRDVLKVSEYFMFDPTEDYLKPPFRGFRLMEGEYRPIKPVDGRLPSEVLGLHLEQMGTRLGLYDPSTGRYLPTPDERADQEQTRAETAEARAETAEARAETAEARAETAEARAETAEARAEVESRLRLEAEMEKERIRRELEDLRRRLDSRG